MILLRFLLILVDSPRPIFGYLIISYVFVLFSYGFDTFPVDFNRRPSPPILGYLMFSYCFPMVFLYVWYVSG